MSLPQNSFFVGLTGSLMCPTHRQTQTILCDSEFTAVIVCCSAARMEGTTEKTGGMAFEVILKPASSDATPPHVGGSPTRERPLSQGDIDRKLKEAEERRLVRYSSSEIIIAHIFDSSLNPSCQ